MLAYLQEEKIILTIPTFLQYSRESTLTTIKAAHQLTN